MESVRRIHVVVFATTVLVAGLIAIPQAAHAGPTCPPGSPNCSEDNTSASSSQNGSSGSLNAGASGIAVTTNQGGRKTTSTKAIPATVLPPCYYKQGLSGADFAVWVASNAKEILDDLSNGRPVDLPDSPEITAHATEDGHWYVATCSFESFGTDYAAIEAYYKAWEATHPLYVWVAAADSPPPIPVPPEVLEMMARQTIDQLVEMPGLNFNPTARAFVNLTTWMWIDPADWAPISVTAAAGGNSVTVTATPQQFSVTGLPAGSTTDTTCANGGRTYFARATDADTDCWIKFSKSSGGEPGQKWTFTISLAWHVTAVGAPLTGDDVLTTSTDQSLAVWEVQTVNGG